MQYCWGKHSGASRMVAIARTDEVSKTKPCGIMPSRAPTVVRIASEMECHGACPESSQTQSCKVLRSGFDIVLVHA